MLGTLAGRGVGWEGVLEVLMVVISFVFEKEICVG